MIDILVPVLGRPQNVVPLIKSIKAATNVSVSIHFLCSPDDPEQVKACLESDANVQVMSFPVGHCDYGKKMNAGYRSTSRPFLLMAADDLDFRSGWDLEALAVAEQTGAGVIGTDDMANPHVRRGKWSTHPLVRRSYVDEQGACLDGPGWLCHEGYDHNYTDVEISQLAQARGQWAFAPRSQIKHLHPGFGGNPTDDTYAKGFRQFKRDQQLYVRRRRLFK